MVVVVVVGWVGWGVGVEGASEARVVVVVVEGASEARVVMVVDGASEARVVMVVERASEARVSEARRLANPRGGQCRGAELVIEGGWRCREEGSATSHLLPPPPKTTTQTLPPLASRTSTCSVAPVCPPRTAAPART